MKKTYPSFVEFEKDVFPERYEERKKDELKFKRYKLILRNSVFKNE
jgi:hypothetical protein